MPLLLNFHFQECETSCRYWICIYFFPKKCWHFWPRRQEIFTCITCISYLWLSIIIPCAENSVTLCNWKKKLKFKNKSVHGKSCFFKASCSCMLLSVDVWIFQSKLTTLMIFELHPWCLEILLTKWKVYWEWERPAKQGN